MYEQLITLLEAARQRQEESYPGLSCGDMGISLVYALLAKGTGRDTWSNNSSRLLHHVLEQAAALEDISFDTGLSGIGWGVAWLAQQGQSPFTDTDTLLADVDEYLLLQPEGETTVSDIRRHLYFLQRLTGQHPENSRLMAAMAAQSVQLMLRAEEQLAGGRPLQLQELAAFLQCLTQLPEDLRASLPADSMHRISDAVISTISITSDPWRKAYLALLLHAAGERVEQSSRLPQYRVYVAACLEATGHSLAEADNARLLLQLKVSALLYAAAPQPALRVYALTIVHELSGRTLRAGLYDGYAGVLAAYTCLEQPSLLRNWHSLIWADITVSHVPAVIHLIVGPGTNALIDRCLQSWRRLQEHGYTVRIWNDALIAAFLEEYYPFATAAFSHARNHGEASDIARYLIVHAFGGCYMDWDIELLLPDAFRDLTGRYPYGFLIIDPVNDTLASEAFAAGKGEPYLLSLAEDIVAIYNSGRRDTMLTPQYSGPYRMRDSLQLHRNSRQTQVPVKEMFVYDYAEIRTMPERTVTVPLIHYWLHTWMKPASPQPV
ncbi:glycosyltransferase family 32 protein [Chitinophaga solisilvae]|uniref:glycosyltransferase family 32 protein n=1 Tax=Chitinophaga solisilvae TaxID=1233460 RepID=UPI00136F7A92|nr:glycosyltransferase [Chitinophaga solisilvae]